MTKEERRRAEARRKEQKHKAAKGAVIALLAVCVAVLVYLLTRP